MKIQLALSGLLLSSLLYAESLDEALDGFDDTSTQVVEQSSSDNVMDGFNDDSSIDTDESNMSEETTQDKKYLIEGLTGKLTQQVAYSYNGVRPYNKFSSFKSSILLDYEHKFENGWRFKTNGKWYYDAVYDLRNEYYSNDELKQRRHETELFDAYVEGSITDTLDAKLGRQVVVWGRSDTIRITDILNPIDNRRPGMVDIEDLRLPVGMAKFDYFINDWRVTPIAIIEQRFSKNPAFGSAYNPMTNPNFIKESANDVTYALSVGGEFSGWDVNFYGAHVYDDNLRVTFSPRPTVTHSKINMAGMALNILHEEWLFKSELAYFDKLKFTTTGENSFSRTDLLVGAEYKGIADTMFSYDISLRHMNSYDNRLGNEAIAVDKNTYQHAFRVSSDFVNATIHANYLISLFGKKLNEGGFQRAWIKYDIADAISANVGVVDYIGGSKLFDSIKDNDMVFADISYSF